MLALTAVLAYVCLFAAHRAHQHDIGVRRLLLRASVAWAACAVLIIEALGSIHAITPISLSLAWLSVSAASIHWSTRGGHKSARLRMPRLEILDVTLIALVALIVGLSGLVAWFGPPSTADSLNYHMARVAHWAQNRSVAPFATGIEWQNGSSPGAEFIVLHAYVLGRGDQLANLVDWLAFLGCIVGVSVVAGQLGASRRAQILAAVIAATIPMAITQASSTMNDIVVALWTICVAAETLGLAREKTSVRNVIYLSLAAGMALLTKATAVAYLLPFALWAAVVIVRSVRLRGAALRAGLCVTIVLVLNLGYLTRNWVLYRYPFGVPQVASSLLFPYPSWRFLASSLLRHAGLHAGTPWPVINDVLGRGIIKANLLLGLSTSDPRTTSVGEWFIRRPTTAENIAGNPVHAYLYVGIALAAVLLWRRVSTTARVYFLATGATFLIFCAVFKWQVFSSRYHVPFFVLYVPFAALVLGRIRSAAALAGIALGLVLSATPWILSIQERPLVPLEGMAQTQSVLKEPRWDSPIVGDPYTESATMILEGGCSQVGLTLGGASPEYLLWMLLGAPDDDLHLEWIVAGTPSARYREPGFLPCAVVCDACPEEWLSVRGLPLALRSGGVRLFMQAPATWAP